MEDQNAAVDENDGIEYSPPFSVIKFMRLFEKGVHELEDAYGAQTGLTIQKDAFARLGGTNDDEPHDEELLAEYIYGRKLTDTTMRFALSFTESQVVIEVEPLGPIIMSYAEAFRDERQAAKQLVALLGCMLNGQLSVLVTHYKGRWCASELVLRSEKIPPTIIWTHADYPLFSGGKAEGYDCTVLKNTEDAIPQKIPAGFFLCDYDLKGHIIQKGRAYPLIASPLTKEMFEYASSELGLRSAGKAPEETEWQLFYRTWEFWVGLGLLIGAVYWLVGRGWLPHFFTDQPIVMMPLATLLCYLVLVPYLKRKQARKVAQEQQPQKASALTQAYRQNRGRFWLGGLLAATLALTGTKIFDERGVHAFVTLYTMSHHYPWLLVVPILLVVAVLFLFIRKISVAWGLLAASVAGGVAIFEDVRVADPNFPAPEPFASAFAVTWIIIWVLTLVVLIWNIRRLLPGLKAGSVESKLRRVQKAHIVLSFIASTIGLVGIGVFGAYITPDMVSMGTPYVMLLGMLLSVMAVISATILLASKHLEFQTHSWFLVGYLFAVLGLLGLVTTEKINDVPSLPWALIFSSVFLPFITMLTHMYIQNKAEKLALNEAIFDEKIIKPKKRS